VKKPSSTETFVPSGFFVLRTPLLPYDELLGGGERSGTSATPYDGPSLDDAGTGDGGHLRSCLQSAMARPEVREALFVASPDLDQSFEVWRRGPDGDRARRVERALARYFLRMAGRPTPFGLFAGCSTGRIGAETRLRLAARETYRRRTRLDSGYLLALADALGSDASLRSRLRYRPNATLQRVAGRFRYVESRVTEGLRTHHRVDLEITDYLEATLRRAEEGASRSDLAAALAASDPAVGEDEAERYVDELIAGQILVSDLAPPVTGEDPVRGMLERLKSHEGTSSVAERLERVAQDLESLDRQGMGAPSSCYRAVAGRLEELPAKVDPGRLFQVDLMKPSAAATLGPEPLGEIARGVEVLSRIVPAPETDLLEAFRSAFQDRYNGREVPLLEALDQDAGIGFPPSGGALDPGGPLLDGLTFPPEKEAGMRWGSRHSFLLRRVHEVLLGGGKDFILDEEDLKRLEEPDPRPLPGAFAATVTLAAPTEEALDGGDFSVLLHHVTGPSGVRLLGRFCFFPGDLRQEVERHLRAEEALEPDAVFAEIVHLPEGRMGNVLARPVLREHEIPFVGASGAPPERQISIQDLRVSVAGDRIVLRSEKLGRRVVPRLTSAHNYTWRSLAVYRFLGLLQSQAVASELFWSWGPLEEAPFLPRVTTGRLVLSRARWVLDRKEIRRFEEAGGKERFREIGRWRREREAPRRVDLVDGDHFLPLDLEDALCADLLAEQVKGRERAVLMEAFPAPDELCVSGPEGRFAHEMIVPFVRRPAPEPAVHSSPAPEGEQERRFAPGSSWLYAKCYAGAATADRVLRDLIRPLGRQAIDSGAADLWFFLRYRDPEEHLRFRLHGEPEALKRDVAPRLEESAARFLGEGLLWRFSFDTYDREVERYGGLPGVELAERIFHADSEAVTEILESLAGDEGADARWRLALAGMDSLASDFGLDLAGKRALAAGARRSLARELQVDRNLEIELGSRFRRERRFLEEILESPPSAGVLSEGLGVLRRRSERIRGVARELQAAREAGRISLAAADLLPSFIHLHVNRLLRSAHRAQEFVLYDFLGRLYESRHSRARAAGNRGAHPAESS
jgi:class I lanthipeptide synthase